MPLPPTAWRRKRDRLLFVYLLVAGAPVARETLLEALWPDLGPSSAAASLNVSWSNVKRALEPGLPEGLPSAYLVIEGIRYGLRRASITTDVQAAMRPPPSSRRSPGAARVPAKPLDIASPQTGLALGPALCPMSHPACGRGHRRTLRTAAQ